MTPEIRANMSPHDLVYSLDQPRLVNLTKEEVQAWKEAGDRYFRKAMDKVITTALLHRDTKTHLNFQIVKIKLAGGYSWRYAQKEHEAIERSMFITNTRRKIFNNEALTPQEQAIKHLILKKDPNEFEMKIFNSADALARESKAEWSVVIETMAKYDINAWAEVHESKLRAQAQSHINSKNNYSVTHFFPSAMSAIMLISLKESQPKINRARTLAILGLTVMLVALTVIAYLIYFEYVPISPLLITHVISSIILSLGLNTLLKSISSCLLQNLNLNYPNSNNKLESFILGIPTYEKILR